MKILHLVAYSLYSGPVPSVLGLARAQASDGHSVSVCIDRKRGNFDGFEEEAEPLIEEFGLAHLTALTLSTKATPLEVARDVMRLRRIVTDSEIDVLHAHMSHDHTLATIACLGLRRAPAVVRTFHARRSLVKRIGQTMINRSADGWITRNKADHERALSSFGLPSGKTHLIPGSIDASKFSVASEEARLHARNRFGLPKPARIVGQVALIANRGQEELVEALSTLGREDCHVLFVGSGEKESALKEKVQTLGLSAQVHFSGYLRGPDLNQAYAAMDAAFVSGPGNDASVRSMLEAMASGIPVLGVTVGAVADALLVSRGYAIKRLDGSSVRYGVQDFLNDADSRAKGAAGRTFVESERSFAQEWQKTKRLYEQVLHAFHTNQS